MSWSTGGSSFDKTTGTVSSIFPYPALPVFQESRDVLSAAFCYFSASRLALTAQGETDAVKGQYVSGGYFDGMGVVPLAGRLVQPEDDTCQRQCRRGPQRSLQPPPLWHPGSRGGPDRPHQRQAVQRDRRRTGVVLRRRARRDSRRLHSPARRRDRRHREQQQLPGRSLLLDRDHGPPEAGRQPRAGADAARTGVSPVREDHRDNGGAAQRPAGPDPSAWRHRARQPAPAVLPPACTS